MHAGMQQSLESAWRTDTDRFLKRLDTKGIWYRFFRLGSEIYRKYRIMNNGRLQSANSNNNSKQQQQQQEWTG
jgi:hypothetical protein